MSFFRSFHFAFAVSFLIPFLCVCESIHAQADFNIKAYDINVVTSIDNILDVTETIVVNFYFPKHGIFRNIPLISTSSHKINGVRSANTHRMSVKHVRVSDGITGNEIPFQDEVTGDNLVLQIGDPDSLASVEKTYVIQYQCIIGDDGVGQYDEFYFDLIGSGWKTTIRNVTFSVNMPASFDHRKIYLSSGFGGSGGGAEIEYSIRHNNISGRVNKTLQPGEKLTAYIELPEAYFNVKRAVGWIIFYAIMGIVPLSVFFFFKEEFFYSCPEKTNPPADLNPAEAEYVLNEYVSSKGISSLIIYWASKGYLLMTQQGKELKLNRCREADSRMKPYEQLLFNKLFEHSATFTTKELPNNFFETVSKVKQLIADSFATPGRVLFINTGTKAQWVCFIISTFTAFVLVLRPVLEGHYNSAGDIVLMVLLALLLVTVCLILLAGMGSCAQKAGFQCGLFVFTVLGYLFVLFIMLKSGEVKSGPLPWGWLGIISAMVSGLSGAFCKKRTVQGQAWLKELIGLRCFIKKIYKPKTKALLSPNQYQDLVAYAYAMNIRRLSNVHLITPVWFNNGISLDGVSSPAFLTLLNCSVAELQCSLNTSSDGLSGGGDSGGGYGGGGGGSW